MHACDDPSCINPGCLSLGTMADNNRDKSQKGRSKSNGLMGEQVKRHVFTEDQVRAIRGDHRPYSQIATELGVSKSAVQHVKNGRCWKHVA